MFRLSREESMVELDSQTVGIKIQPDNINQVNFNSVTQESAK